MAVRLSSGDVGGASIPRSRVRVRNQCCTLLLRVDAHSLCAWRVSGAPKVLARACQRRGRGVDTLAGHVVVTCGHLAATRWAQCVQLSLSQVSVLAAQSVVARRRLACVRVGARHRRVDATTSGRVARPNVARVCLSGAIARLERAVISLGVRVAYVKLVPASCLIRGRHKVTLRPRPNTCDGVARSALRANTIGTRQAARLHAARGVGQRIVERGEDASTEASVAIRVARSNQARVSCDAVSRKSRSETLTAAAAQVTKGFLTLVVGRARLLLHIALSLAGAVVSAH